MKKLLSLLSIVTISGTAISNVVAISSYEKEEKLIRKKRSIFNLQQSINGIIQEDPYWCGPAVGEIVLRYFGLNPLRVPTINTSNTYQRHLANAMQTIHGSGTYPQNLIHVLNNAINVFSLNNRRQYSITMLNANYGNTLQFYNLVHNSLENNVPIILAHNGILPINNNQNAQNNQHFIVITAVDNNGGNIQEAIYTYIDPADGRNYQFTGNDLRDILNATIQNPQNNIGNPQNPIRSNSYLLTYVNPAQTTSLGINNPPCNQQIQFNFRLTQLASNICTNSFLSGPGGKRKRELSEVIQQSGKVYYVGYNLLDQNAYLLPNIPDSVTSMVLLHKDTAGELKANAAYFGTTNGVYYRKGNGSDEVIKVSGLNEAIQSIQIDKDGSAWALTEIFKNKKMRSSGFNDESSLTCLAISGENPYYDSTKDLVEEDWHDKINIHLSLNTCLAIEKFFFENNKSSFENYLLHLLNKIKKNDSITDSDRRLITGYIYKYFSFFHETLINLKNQNDNSKIMVLHVIRNSDISSNPTGNNDMYIY